MSFDTQKQEQAGTLSRTPRRSDALPQQLGGFKTIADGLDYAARGVTGFNFYGGRGALADVLTYTELRHRALSTARRHRS